jgi:dihydrofolate synthase/folylpolyglutamate synthase
VLDLPSPILKKEQVDISIIEVGMRKTRCNKYHNASSFSNHKHRTRSHAIFRQHYRLIAQEKAGIIKPNVPVVIGEYTDETKDVFC